MEEPYGIMPRKHWLKMRIKQIDESIERYKEANLEPSSEWIEEKTELIKMLTKL